MLIKTHLALGVLVTLVFLPYVNSKILFAIVVLAATFIPDIDSAYSTLGHKKIFRPLQFFVKHRGIIHSFSVCILISLVFATYIPVLALPFFLGYGFHLLIDSFTVDGIRPFWPAKYETKGRVRTGGKVEDGIFWSFVFVSVLLLLRFVL